MSTLSLPQRQEQWLYKVTICALDGTSLLQTSAGSRSTTYEDDVTGYELDDLNYPF